MFFVTGALTAAVWFAQSLRLVDLIVNRGLSAEIFLYLAVLILPRFLDIVRLQRRGHCAELRRRLERTLIVITLEIPKAEEQGRPDQHTADQPRGVLRYQVFDSFQLFVIGQKFFCHGFSANRP